MSMVRALMRNIAKLESDPAIILRDVNNAVAHQNPKCQFVTVSLCVFDPQTGTLDVSSAGHPLPLVRHPDGSIQTLEIQQGPLLGFDDRAEPYPKLRCQLNPGDLLVLYTDGLTEAPAPDNRMFGLEGLRAALGEVPFPTKLPDGRSPCGAPFRRLPENASKRMTSPWRYCAFPRRGHLRKLADELQPAFVNDRVAFTKNDHARLPELGFRRFGFGETHDRQLIAGLAQMRRSAVEHDL